ncbi:hypothetical protein [Streptomyces chrestomyceticus]|uniref:hypothetical protein n=1 Tax=Streptomyces chrestomyceticus TaxID=68185 RepID=UPI0037B2D8AF
MPYATERLRECLREAVDSASDHDLLLRKRHWRCSPARRPPTAVFGLLRTAVTVSRTWLRRPTRSRPDGPRVSVRELGSAQQVTLFQEMDVSRYVKTVQDRITNGVLQALRSKGYDTREFERQSVTIGQGAIYIGAMGGGVASTGARTDIHSTPGDRHGPTRGGRTAPP